MNRIFTITGLILMVVSGLALESAAQIKKRQPAKKAAQTRIQPETSEPAGSDEKSELKKLEKKNERPQQEVVSADYETGAAPQELQKKNQSPKKPAPRTTPAASVQASKNVFAYEFSQPDFLVSRLLIEHDENGRGTIAFEKKGFGGEALTEPIQLSSVSLEKIKNLFQTLNFLDSTEVYQSTVREFPHLGTVKIRLRTDGRERQTEFNWTENQNAKALAEEYQRIGEQFVWMFDISVSVENQPLEAPRLMDKLDILIKRNLISDPAQMVPLLKKLSNDERIPLIARNHATRIVKEIEKKK